MRNKIIKSLYFISLIILVISCQKVVRNNKQANPKVSYGSIMIDGASRRYVIYAPKNIKNLKNIPLIFELHGGGIYIEDMIGTSGHKTPYKLWMNLADINKFIVIYPEGINGSYNKPTWNDCRKDCSVSSHANDVLFIKTLIDKISSNYDIDQDRIYVSGTSNGGFMALRLACELSDKIAAVASIAAAMPKISNCKKPNNPISVLFMNGTNDNHMPYNGGYLSNPPNPKHGSVLSTADSIKYWININHTNITPSTYIFPDLDQSDGGIVEKFVYKNEKQNTEIVLYKINGGGHSAPSIQEQFSSLFELYFNKQNHDIEMTTEVWKFFKNKRRYKHSIK